MSAQASGTPSAQSAAANGLIHIRDGKANGIPIWIWVLVGLLAFCCALSLVGAAPFHLCCIDTAPCSMHCAAGEVLVYFPGVLDTAFKVVQNLELHAATTPGNRFCCSCEAQGACLLALIPSNALHWPCAGFFVFRWWRKYQADKKQAEYLSKVGGPCQMRWKRMNDEPRPRTAA